MSKQDNHTRTLVYLAALLHDIGKFSQRADSASSANSGMLSANTKALERALCPEHISGKYTIHKHTLYTAQFLEELSTQFSGWIQPPGMSLQRLAAAHHKPSAPLEHLVQLADHLASGMDRTAGKALEDAEQEKDWDSFRKVRMVSIFEHLGNAAPDERNTYQYALDVQPLAIENDSNFPREKADLGAAPDYARLWKSFTDHVATLPKTSPEAFAENMYYLLHWYTTHIPSTTVSLPDVSLFDHLKMTGAMALCLFDYLTKEKAWGMADWNRPGDGDEPFLLIGCDLSGIQSFLYDIAGSDAAKNLKGRSFYLQMLLDSVMERLLADFSLFRGNVVYSSGGGFYVLAPNTAAVREGLDAIQKQVERQLFELHGARLYVALDAATVSIGAVFHRGQAQNNGRNGLAGVWEALAEKLNARKRKRYSHLMSESPERFFAPIGQGAEAVRDAITGDELEPQHAVSWEEGKKVHHETLKQIDLGKKLKKAEVWITTREEKTYWKGKDKFDFPWNIYNYLPGAGQIEDLGKALKGTVDLALVRTLNGWKPGAKDFRGKDNVYGFAFYGGNHYPTDTKTSHPITFDQLAGNDSFKRLGVLRMDVDNLGKLFISGFPDGQRTFSRYSQLSRSLDQFFQGYINTLVSKEEFVDHIYVVYSGGDDLFLLGRWDKVVALASEIRQAFRKWVCHNPHITLSGGLAIVPPKFPILKSAQKAGALEDEAKGHSIRDGQQSEKNSIAFLERALNWHTEWPVVVELQEKLTRAITDSDNPLPRGMLQRIYAYSEMAHEARTKNSPERWRWLMAYDFGRLAQMKRYETHKQLLADIQQAAYTDTYGGTPPNTQYTMLELLQTAARWTELITKNTSHE